MDIASVERTLAAYYADEVAKAGTNRNIYVEVEARFKKLDESEKGFHDIKASEFFRFKTNIDKTGLPFTQEYSEDFIDGNIRKTVLPAKSNTPEYVTYRYKTTPFDAQGKRKDIFVYEYGMKYAVNIEEVLEKPPARFAYKLTRTKDRYSYYIGNNKLKLDLTKVTMTEANKRPESRYEVELEKLTSCTIAEFVAYSMEIFKALHETEIEYNTHQIRQLCLDVRKDLAYTHATFDYFNKEVLVQARNLKPEDLVFGGIIGNTKTHYAVTHKADGVRKVLVFHASGIWLIMPPFEFNWISKQVPDPNVVGTYLDGEMITVDKRYINVTDRPNAPTNKYWYLAFDCLAVQHSSVIQQKDLHIRNKICTDIAEKNKSRDILINSKAYVHFESAEDFFAKMTIMLNQQKSLSYHTDGFMFTPYNIEYNSRSDKKANSERVLTSLPDICKWKPSNELTIDFWVQPKLNEKSSKIEYQLYCSQRGAAKGVIFTGTNINPFHSSMVSNTNNMLTGIPMNTVVEFEYKDNRLHPKRLRLEKPVPNNIEVAQSIWNDIFDPIADTTLTGDDVYYVKSLLQRTFIQLLEPLIEDNNTIYIFTVDNYIFYRVLFNKIATLASSVVLVVSTITSKEGLNDNIEIVSDKQPLSIKRNDVVIGFMDVLPDNVFKARGLNLFEISIDQQLHKSYKNVDLVKQLGGVRMIDNTRDYKPYHLIDSYTLNYEPMMSEQERDFAQLIRVNIYDRFPRESIIIHPKLKENYDYPIRRTWVDIDENKDIVETSYPNNTSTGLLTCTAISDYIYISEEKKDEPEYEKVDPDILAIKDKETETVASQMEEEDTSSEFLSLLPIIPDDVVDDIACSWYNNVVRIGTIGDGSCFVHAVLKAYLQSYQNNEVDRKAYAVSLRTSMSRSVLATDPLTDTTFYESAGNGQLAELGRTYEESHLSRKEVVNDFSSATISRLLDSSEFLGDEVFSLIAEMLLVNIHVVRATTDDIFKHASYMVQKDPGSYYNVVITGDGMHFETIGIKTSDGYIQTAFASNDPFVSAIASASGL